MLFAYCDASYTTSTKRAAATTFICTEDTFITCFTKVYNDIESSVHAELLGVHQTMKYISENCKGIDKVVLATDSRTVAVKYISILANWIVPSTHEYYAEYKDLLNFSKDFNVNVQHVRGHQYTHNPNKICDVLSKLRSDE